jgi:hypothetical protein
MGLPRDSLLRQKLSEG